MFLFLCVQHSVAAVVDLKRFINKVVTIIIIIEKGAFIPFNSSGRHSYTANTKIYTFYSSKVIALQLPCFQSAVKASHMPDPVTQQLYFTYCSV